MDILTQKNPIIDISNGFTGALLSPALVKVFIKGSKKGVQNVPVRIVAESKKTSPSTQKVPFSVYYKKAMWHIDKAFVVSTGKTLEIVGKVSLILADFLYEYSLQREYRSIDQFEKKYTKAELVILAQELPRNIKLTYPNIKTLPGYRHLSKRHIYEIIDIVKVDIKDKAKMYKQAFLG